MLSSQANVTAVLILGNDERFLAESLIVGKLLPAHKFAADADGFCSTLKEYWRRILAKLIKRLIMSMPKRIAA